MTTRHTARTFLIFAALVFSGGMNCNGGEKSPDASLPAADGSSQGSDVRRDAAVAQVDSPAVDAAAAADVASLGFDTAAPDLPAPLDVSPDGAGPAQLDTGAAIDSPPIDSPPIDGPAIVYSCGAFPLGSDWTTAAGFRSAIVAAGSPLVNPVALTFSGGAFGDGFVYIVDQGANTVLRMNAKTGALSAFVSGSQWPQTPSLLTTILWDSDPTFDGLLYVSDQGGDGDSDSRIFRSNASGTTQIFAAAPGPGLDDIYGMVFSPGGSYPAGLYVSGDTDGSGPGTGLFTSAGTGATFATFAGIEGLAVDKSGRFGGGLFASMPAGGGYSGDDTLSRIKPDGTKGAPLVSGIPGIHAVAFAPAGPFGGDAYVASWSSQKIVRIKPDGSTSDLATGLSLTNYDGNILAFSPDGRVLFVADRSNARIVCIEPTN